VALRELHREGEGRMTELKAAVKQALEAMQTNAYAVVNEAPHRDVMAYYETIASLVDALGQPERTLTDEVIANLWHQNGGFHHHFARAIERWLKGQA